MIPINEVVPKNLYSQDDALFLLGSGFTKRAAKELLCEACRKGDLDHSFYRKRYWFTGREFLEWVAKWSGGRIYQASDTPDEKSVAETTPLRHNEQCRFGVYSPQHERR